MFSTISWSAYVECMLLVVLSYYAGVILIYYRRDIQLKFTSFRQQAFQKSTTDQTATASQPTNDTRENNDLLFSSVHELMDELKAVFQSAADKQFQKEELLMALQVKLRHYQQLKGTAFQVAVNNHLSQQAQLHCKISLDDMEIKQLWQDFYDSSDKGA